MQINLILGIERLEGADDSIVRDKEITTQIVSDED